MSDDLAALLAAVADSVVAEPPDWLRAETLAGAFERRPTLRPVDAVAPCSPLAAYRAMAECLWEVLSSLQPGDWDAPAHVRHGPVRAVVAHLVGVEELVLGWVGARPAPDPAATADHVAATRDAVERLAHDGASQVAARWHQLTMEVEHACQAVDPRHPVLAHDLPTDVDGLLVLRAFELLAHTDDVCRATGRALQLPDAAVLALMSSRLMAALPFALALRSTTVPDRTARLVLTGQGAMRTAGGCYDVALDPTVEAGRADVTITVDVVDLCLLAARRRDPQQVMVAVDGDAELAGCVLAAADAFARD